MPTSSWRAWRSREQRQAREWRSVATTRRGPCASACARNSTGRRGRASSSSFSGLASPKTAAIFIAAAISLIGPKPGEEGEGK
uniref:Uncharacterized protein n=1 Tax=Arundo donax TaxID=35708 RepID=A0A0A9H610_ARUDO